MNGPAQSRVALVTGAGRNIGRQIALRLSELGYAIAVNIRSSLDEGRAVVEEIVAGNGEALLCVADVTDDAAVARMVSDIEQRWGRLDVLVNNAAVRQEVSLDQMSVEQWRTTLAVVLDGAFFCTRAALPLLRKSAHASIVNIGGMTGHTGAARRAHVVTAKAGLAGLTRALAHELAPDNITVNCVAPGLIDTVRNAASASAAPDHRRRHQPLLGRHGTADEVAQAVVWLAGPNARFVTGQTLHVNGGAFLGG
ncbi:MAG TPA: 3-oxoacyl-ACP reductase FabG [Burkholderiaceae bacterium]|nr:3-oxoacyl-ACP reductase FabG [Burkholderiaceae bacterium]